MLTNRFCNSLVRLYGRLGLYSRGNGESLRNINRKRRHLKLLSYGGGLIIKKQFRVVPLKNLNINKM